MKNHLRFGVVPVALALATAGVWQNQSKQRASEYVYANATVELPAILGYLKQKHPEALPQFHTAVDSDELYDADVSRLRIATRFTRELWNKRRRDDWPEVYFTNPRYVGRPWKEIPKGAAVMICIDRQNGCVAFAIDAEFEPVKAIGIGDLKVPDR